MKLTSEYYGVRRDKSGWEHTRWECKLKVGKRVVRFPFRMGMAHTNEPETIEVIASLLSDAETGKLSFEEFCEEFRPLNAAEAYATWKGCRAAVRKVAWLWPSGVPQRIRTQCEAL